MLQPNIELSSIQYMQWHLQVLGPDTHDNLNSQQTDIVDRALWRSWQDQRHGVREQCRLELWVMMTLCRPICSVTGSCGRTGYGICWVAYFNDIFRSRHHAFTIVGSHFIRWNARLLTRRVFGYRLAILACSRETRWNKSDWISVGSVQTRTSSRDLAVTYMQCLL